MPLDRVREQSFDGFVHTQRDQWSAQDGQFTERRERVERKGKDHEKSQKFKCCDGVRTRRFAVDFISPE